MFIPDPDPDFSFFPDPAVNKAPDAGSVTLLADNNVPGFYRYPVPTTQSEQLR
jgi:hypothetical protein